jgi:hypothetical protein
MFFDSVFGWSSNWRRFMLAAQELEASLAALTVDWATLGIQNITMELKAKHLAQLKRLKRAMTEIHSIIELESRQWSKELERNLSELHQRTLIHQSGKTGQDVVSDE